ncbi:MAG: class I SAM-dependent methyltransferase family protein [Candidatus Methylarchaceae archaeon HK02M1]|nr:class I SAM-dependent methyltransferase family protein [Candidatus Methylarchaceae archaeon HK02M1]
MPKMLKRALEKVLTTDEIRQLYASFDIIGDIIIIKIPEPLLDKKSIIAKALLDRMKPIKTVLRQATPVSGEYRIRDLEYLLGEEKTITFYKEYGCIFKVDLAKVYFSPRLSTERFRIAKKVEVGETVVNMFAGVGSFSIMISKNQSDSKAYSIDLNPDAYNLMVENIRLNKVVGRVVPFLGDVRFVVKESLRGVADRVLMPLPEKAIDYIDVAIEALKLEGGVIHYYTHAHASKGEDPIKGAVKELEASLKVPHKILESRVVREVGPRWNQVVLDIQVGLKV